MQRPAASHEAMPDRPASRTGRPPALSQGQRRARLIDAAEAVFFEAGYHASTMDDVAQRAGMSKRTLYQVFPAKAALFEALLHDRLQVMTLPVEGACADIEQGLTDLLTHIAAFVLSAGQTALARLIIAEGHRSPELVLALKKLEIGRGHGTLERWFAANAGRIDLGPPAEASAIVFGMIVGEFWVAALLNTDPLPDQAAIRARVGRCVGILLGQGRSQAQAR